MEKTAYLFVLNTMADWEPTYLTSELNTGRFFRKDTPRYSVKTAGLSKDSVVTMGGITLIPDTTLDELGAGNTDLLILPGGDLWMDPAYAPVMDKTKQLLDAGVTVAAICGATMALAQAGILDNTAHTSNDLGALKGMCPNYRGENHYRNEPAVVSENLITASGVASLEFARQVLGHLNVFSPETLDTWYKLYKLNEAKYYYALMESVSRQQEVAH
jgi:putative intracellular protease/amidase